METEGKWIRFQEINNAGKRTRVFVVIAKEHGFTLGKIKWYTPFRKYSFFPENNTVYENDCLKDIANFIENIMEERKQELIKYDNIRQ